MKKEYLPRIADEVLKDCLDSYGAVLITGPKWCGKSTTAEQVAKSVVYMQNKNDQAQNIELAKVNPSLFLQGEPPKLIDEWQVISFIWDAVRFEVDQRDEFGQFILTGSSPAKKTDDIMHSGIGRIVKMVMRPMSLYESKDSTGAISLKNLFDGETVIGAKCDNTLLDYAFYTCRGGWPKSVGQTKKVALNLAKNYYNGLVQDDIRDVDNVKRDRFRTEAILRAYARNIGGQVSINTLLEDVRTYDNAEMSAVTLNDYLNALRKLYVIDDTPAWNPNLRSKTAVRTSPTRYFVDPSIACSALGIGPSDLIKDLNTFGLLFECMCVRDLKIYAEKNDGTIYHYRDKNGLEADAVIHFRNGQWAPIEVKLGNPDKIEESAKNLLKLADSIDKTKMKAPSFLMILTATPYAYRREDGVLVVPVGCLKD
jgi:hypothetical protein